MRALSLSQPWCWAVVDELVRKHIENRSWAPPITTIDKWICIHAAKSFDDKNRYTLRERVGEIAEGEELSALGYLLAYGYQPPARFVTSAIVAVAQIDRVVTEDRTLPDDQKRWYFGPYGWVLAGVQKLREPLAIGGKQGLWTVPDFQARQIYDQMAGREWA